MKAFVVVSLLALTSLSAYASDFAHTPIYRCTANLDKAEYTILANMPEGTTAQTAIILRKSGKQLTAFAGGTFSMDEVPGSPDPMSTAVTVEFSMDPPRTLRGMKLSMIFSMTFGSEAQGDYGRGYIGEGKQVTATMSMRGSDGKIKEFDKATCVNAAVF